MSFYRKTLSNMMEFWTKLDKDGLFNWVLKLWNNYLANSLSQN
jgi:hypothetical protein